MNMQTVAEIAKARGIWDYEAQPIELVDHCNLCGHTVPRRQGRKDRYGYWVQEAQCSCGLNFLGYRMTREAYARFYETAYRPLVSAFHGREINADTIQEEQGIYASRLIGYLRTAVDRLPYRVKGRRTLLDIGGSTGVVARALSEGFEYAMDATVLDPSPVELKEAMRAGLNTWLNCLEEVPAENLAARGPWDLITLCQTADHLLDLMGALKKIKGLLSPDGLFWADIVDFDKTREVKIDHPFNLTEKTFRAFLSKAGFNLLQVNYAPDGVHIGFLCKAAA